MSPVLIKPEVSGLWTQSPGAATIAVPYGSIPLMRWFHPLTVLMRWFHARQRCLSLFKYLQSLE
jgi:hypothetical protein